MIDPLSSLMIGVLIGLILAGTIVTLCLPKAQPRDKRGRFTKRA